VRIAALDLGSNSFHLVVVDVDGSGAFRVVGRDKEMVRLGAGTLLTGHLAPDAIERALAAASRLKRLAEAQGAETVLAVATSAVREAENGEDLLDRIGHDLRLWPRAISGEEEARLIYLAAAHSVHTAGKPALVVDIGGGSVELAYGQGAELRWPASEKLGALRLSEQFVRTDPLGARDEARLQKRVEEALGPHLARLSREGAPCVVGTSGTILAIGGLCLDIRGDARPESLHHVVVAADDVRRARKLLVGTDLRERKGLPGMQGRADTIVAGVVVLDTVLQALGGPDLVLCEWALREGLLLDYIHGHPLLVSRAESCPDVRRRSVAALIERADAHAGHARQVAALALALFDGTRRRHGLGPPQRELLEHAALLHDVGHQVSYPRHHRHSYYLIRNGDLRGFTPLELEIVASVARYHRRARPRKRHPAFRALPRKARRTVKVLAACLRLADALDRSHRQVVRSLSVRRRGKRLMVHCVADGDAELELWGAARRKEPLEKLLGLPIELEAVRRPAAVLLKHPAAGRIG
jgi:exopolyphosphatase/guanosine-5'-triphosphate,3'-diphosphate pyrophosphatase